MSQTEIFRFVSIRPPQATADTAGTVDDAVVLSPPKSALVDSLRKLRSAGSRANMVAAAGKFVGSADFLSSTRALDQPLAELIKAVSNLPPRDFWNGVTQAFAKTIGGDPSAFVKSDAYAKPSAQVADSLVAAAIDRSVSPQVRSRLVRIARALWLIDRLAGGAPVSPRAFVTAPLVLPDGIFPLPVSDAGLKGQQSAQASATAAAIAARQKHLAQLATSLSSYRQTAQELLTAFTQAPAQPAAAAKATSKAKTAAPKPALSGFLLSDSAAAALSDAAKATLKTAGIADASIDVAKAITRLNQLATGAGSQLYADAGPARSMVRLGNLIIPGDALAGGYPVVADPGPIDTRTPGPCPPVVDTTPPDTSVTVPTGHGDARILGIADLMVVEQELLRYQLGEIARIENILKSEARSRRFKTRDTTSETDTTETDTTTEKEQDLSSTDQFELQTESQTVINENASKDAGLTIHASYGPSVDATANYNSSSSTATQQSNTASTNYAREVTNKAVSRVQTRTLTRRTVTTTHLVEEINRHAFDNKLGTADIVGVYRYVDKIYQAQVVNYGKRLMLEFTVPEPAAFLRYALTNKPVAPVPQINPDPPGYRLANGTSFVPLQAIDITRDNYLYWASKYGAQDVTSPPPEITIATGSKKAPDSMPTVGDRNISSDLFDITIPDGYLCQSAFVNVYGETQEGKHQIVYQLQEQQGEYIEPPDDNVLYSLQPTPTLTVTVNSVGFHNYEVLVTAFCTVTPEKFQDWQLKTFASIMSAYNDQKSAYDQAMEEARLQASDTTANPPNPENNAITEQTELKRGCISLLTGQRFDLFDAVARNVAPYGYPEIDFAEAKAEGTYISFFEESFEWNNMVYVFYPYFWGMKDDWVTLVQLADNDPLFAQFLRAGAARVQVPVRVGFEAAMLTYLSTGELWAGDGALVNSDDGEADPLQLSIVAELKSQTGDNNVDGAGTLSVTSGSATITGDATAFTSDDENRRIIIGGVTYVIKDVQDAQTITLTAPYAGTSATGLGYALGGTLVGQPWEVKLPTDLVKLDSSLAID